MSLPQGDLFQVDHARQRGFKRKAVPSIHALINFFQHQAASLECSSLWIEWSQARSDQVGVDKTQRLGFSRQKVTGKSGFASAVGSCNDDDFLQILPVFSRFYALQCRLPTAGRGPRPQTYASINKNKDLLELGSIRSMTQVIGLFGHMRSGNNYYKRMTF